MKGAGGTANETVERAISKKKQSNRSTSASYDEIWCVLDVEGEDAKHFSTLRSAMDKAKLNELMVVLSNPCFEVWYIAHFEESSERFATSQAVERKLNRLWNAKFNEKYDKVASNHYQRLKIMTIDAIGNAEATCNNHLKNEPDFTKHNSSTQAYKLVEHLMG